MGSGSRGQAAAAARQDERSVAHAASAVCLLEPPDRFTAHAESSTFPWRMAVRTNAYPFWCDRRSATNGEGSSGRGVQKSPDRRFYACKGVRKTFFLVPVPFLGVIFGSVKCNVIGLGLLGGAQYQEEPLGWRIPVWSPSSAGCSLSAVTRSRRSPPRPGTTPGVRPHRRAHPAHIG